MQCAPEPFCKPTGHECGSHLGGHSIHSATVLWDTGEQNRPGPSLRQLSVSGRDTNDSTEGRICKAGTAPTSYRAWKHPNTRGRKWLSGGTARSTATGTERHTVCVSPGSELLLTEGLEQQTRLLFRLLLLHWCFPIYLSDQVIKYLNKSKKKVLIQPSFENFHKTILALLKIILLLDLHLVLCLKAGAPGAPADSRSGWSRNYLLTRETHVL